MKRIKRICLRVATIATLIFLQTTSIFAEAPPANKEFLKALAEDNLNKINFPLGAPSVLRELKWDILIGLSRIIDGIYEGISVVIKRIGFANSDNVQSLVSSYKGIMFGLLIISFTVLSFYLFFRTADRSKNILTNIIICGLVISFFPLMTNQLIKYTSSVSTAIIESGYEEATAKSNYNNVTGKGSDGKGSSGISSVVIASNIVDLEMVKDKGKSKVCWRKKGNPSGYIDGSIILGKAWRNIDITTTMDDSAPYDQRFDGADYKDLPSIIGSIGKGNYYRFQIISWLDMFVVMLMLVAVLGLVLLKIGILIFEAGYSEVYIPFIVVTDLVEGQRTKESIKHFIAIFATIILCVMLLGLFFVGFGWVGNMFADHPYIRLVMYLALGWLAINGPDLIERITGIDVGIQSGYRAMMGAVAAGKLAKDAVKAPLTLATAPIRAKNRFDRYRATKAFINSNKDSGKKMSPNRAGSPNDTKDNYATPNMSTDKMHDNGIHKTSDSSDKKFNSNLNKAKGSSMYPNADKGKGSPNSKVPGKADAKSVFNNGKNLKSDKTGPSSPAKRKNISDKATMGNSIPSQKMDSKMGQSPTSTSKVRTPKVSSGVGKETVSRSTKISSKNVSKGKALNNKNIKK